MERTIRLNNEGVQALNAENYDLAISKLLVSLKSDRSYDLARNNLGIAYNNRGLALGKHPREAVRQFHLASYVDPKNQTTVQNVECIIRMMGKEPDNFDDRIALAE